MRAFLRTRAAGLFALLVLFTGCITIEENYTFKKDGSGTMEYVVDMSQIGEMMKAFEDMNKGGKKDEEAMGSLDLKEEVAALKAVPGIKKVKVNDKDKFVQKVTFNFADINALNAALNVLLEDSTEASYTFFTWEGNTLVRHNNDHAKQLGSGMGKGEDGGKDTTDMSAMLESMKYKYSFTFANDIANTVAAETMLKESPTTRSVKLDTDFSAISKDDKALDLRIELKKP
ncbi:MAG: hypothetical protein JNM62_11015 [Flavobacteriales bacterium]|nr:hypothetical protein [Flavobacteriales bacterium]